MRKKNVKFISLKMTEKMGQILTWGRMGCGFRTSPQR